ncbi:hypothetical protein P691DRAFT_691674 [Macrolepiota fuliginosa MF-IS2]|uniref:Borealin N-terminal domain-containing protein n=1 Tax=Macrolepiota fuliginosa MF-IS2 TaxID=1400762 RepID=A0A9P5XS74_9AGAR|nr:hypothetical protein P691DRAFT_691674 [Macrolepiota fuliginosa MF-IS2]
MDFPAAKRNYTDEEKRQLIANLDIEVAHRSRQFESWLADRLENFTIHQEGQVSRIPKQVRSMTMREFGEKYQGNIQAALRGYQKERLVAAGADANFGEIDKNMRKRKWVEGVEAEMEKNSNKDGEMPRATKTARTAPSPSPKKMAGSSTGPGTAQRKRLASATNKVPLRSGSRTLSRIPASPSPTKAKPPFNAHTPSSNSRHLSRPTSPTKPNPGKSITQPPQQTNRVPSSSSFNPSLPPKTPKFPSVKTGLPGGGGNDPPPAMRLPRKDESMLSLNGSPLANPYQFGMGWFKGIEQAAEEAEEATEAESSQSEPATNGKPLPKRSKNSIVVRRDPSVAFPSTLNGHSRVNSHASFHTAPSSQVPSTSHSRTQSASQNNTSNTLYPTARFPTSHPLYVPPEEQQTPRPMSKVTRSFTALVAIPTKDGHLLEFDPLQTSPGSIDALDGITESAKKQAKVEMGRLVQAAVDKWKVG